ncbi:transcriptional activator protein anr [Litchfieldella qijiaojingensis]|uniref:Transcriptional activator protein anr n=1 Tax=Litchfieldella qijiaojingensis TaxID=980347 RepID=A0ABQ2YB74_9GAMM|nr:fumarate/nitrate reduction transcriptional regulator Fnr [Halomonas qijiaojingensis]GGX77380.1 transcriptional activator protein anr [Halomonas qijiaojingensis]
MTSPSNVLRFISQHDVDCRACHLSSLCLPQGLSMEDIAELNDIAQPLATLRKREALFLQGMPFTSLFVVRSGSLKQVTTTETDEYLVTSFFLPGELIGLDAIAERRYPGSVVALETATVCELPFDRLDELSSRVPELRERLYYSLSQEVHNERLLLRLLLRRTADVRLACFFVAMSERFRRRGYSPYRFRLAMARGEIGNYLGLTVETVSRTLARYQEQELLDIRGREFQILDLERLKRLAETSGRRGVSD